MPVALERRLRSLPDHLPLPDPSVMERVTARVAAELHEPAPRRRVRFGWNGGFAVAAISAAVVAVVVVMTGTVGGGAPRIDPAAAAVLKRASITAAGQPALRPLGPGRFYHFRDTELGWVERASKPGEYASCATACPRPPADWVVKMRVTTNFWIAADGSGARSTTEGRPVFRSAAVRRSYRRVYGFPASHPLGRLGRERFGAAELTFGWGLSYRQIQHLPSDPGKLLDLVRREAAPSSQATDPSSANPLPYEEFVVIGDMLRSSPIKPRVRAAFYTILSELPGVDFVGHVTDPLGRHGIEVAMTRREGNLRDILIFDPHTAQLLSEGDGGYSGWGVTALPGR
ncbi:MAG: CU044_5270 family protein [Gaiellales bacterium]